MMRGTMIPRTTMTALKRTVQQTVARTVMPALVPVQEPPALRDDVRREGPAVVQDRAGELTGRPHGFQIPLTLEDDH